jgi:protein SCO1/2
MAQLVEVKQMLGKDGDKLQALFITLDPERDSAEILKAYIANFDAGFLGLRPSLEQLPELTRHFKIFYKKNEGKTPTSYTLDHSAGSYVFDTQGRVRLYVRQSMSAAAITEDLKILLR